MRYVYIHAAKEAFSYAEFYSSCPGEREALVKLSHKAAMILFVEHIESRPTVCHNVHVQ